jgi:methylamine dehydrogenase accessory protein MauD
MRRGAVILLTAMLTGGVASVRAQDEGLAVGARAPVVTVTDLDGRPVDLGSVIGKKPVLLEFWATWCPICEDLLPRMRAMKARYGDRVAFIGVNVAVNQTRERVRRYLSQHEFPLQVVYDEAGTSTRAFEAPQTSYIVIVDARGNIAYTGVGTEQKFEAALAQVVAGPAAR